MKIGVLTSTRADFGIYIPLLNKIRCDSYFELEIIAFGTHLSEKFGNTINEIISAGFEVKHKLNTLPEDDTPEAISSSIGETIMKFSAFWEANHFNLVFCLGDRYEMFAAVSAASPFRIKFAHIHAGETTLGAIDNAYRHCISLMSEYLFVSTEPYKNRAIEILQEPENIFNVGALSIDNLKQMDFYNPNEIKQKFDLDILVPTILSTFNPETVEFKKNEAYINQLIEAFKQLQNKYQILITMPNADTMGLMVRRKLEQFAIQNPKIILRESLGMKGYLSCMKYSRFLLGNSSSGFVEAAFFPKWVINLGNRQKGRTQTSNIVNAVISCESIIESVHMIENKEVLQDCNIYGDGNAADKIVKIIKSL